MNSPYFITILLVGMLISSCAQFNHYRFQTQAALPAESQKKPVTWPRECAVDQNVLDRKSSARSDEDKRLPGKLCEGDPASPASSSIQHRFYQSKDGETGDYYLSFVEFDDQGWFADRTQMEALFELLKTLEEKNDGHTLIYVYAHGWKHNASACDNNVVCFSRLLERTDLVEQIQEKYVSGKDRRNVVGVYLDWRGLPFDDVLNNLSGAERTPRHVWGAGASLNSWCV